MCAEKRTALYGGTFDPVHVGHLEVAYRVSELFEIEQVLFIPAKVAPHKIDRPHVTEPIHRYAMLALATQNDPKMLISTFELDAADRCYTVETIEHFQQSLDGATELFFVMGADSWSEITTWREWKRLLTITNHIVVTRPGYKPAETAPPDVGQRIVDLQSLDEASARNAIRQPVEGTRIFFTDVVVNDVSATSIRRLASEGRVHELRRFVPEPVVEYIKKYGIYRD